MFIGGEETNECDLCILQGYDSCQAFARVLFPDLKEDCDCKDSNGNDIYIRQQMEWVPKATVKEGDTIRFSGVESVVKYVLKGHPNGSFVARTNEVDEVFGNIHDYSVKKEVYV